MIELFESILALGRMQKASDIHFSMNDHIMMRVDGKLIKPPLSVNTVQDMITSLLSDEQKNKLARLEDIDCVYEDVSHERYRMNIYRENGMYALAVRIIYQNVISIDDYGFPQIFKEFAKMKNGLVLVTGPTGSGKSTTLASIIDYINQNRECHILTIEDPIEYVYQSSKSLIHQREIGLDVKDYMTAITSALREDPDVIVVGEMRDYQTIQAVMTLAETGHLVFSTLHTIGAVKTMDRIIDSFPKNSQEQIRVQLSSVLKGVVSQQLLPLKQGGRKAAFEIMVVDNAISHLIREKKTHMIYSNLQLGSAKGMQTMESHIQQLLSLGEISEEVAKECSDQF